MKSEIKGLIKQNIIIMISIFLLGIISQFLGDFDESMTFPIYLPSALSFTWLYCKNKWNFIGVFLGIFFEAIINLTNYDTDVFGGIILTAIIVAIANSLEAFIIVVLLNFFIKIEDKTQLLFRLNYLILFFCFSVIGTIIAGIIGPLGLIIGGFIPRAILIQSGFSWMISDLAAIMIISPIILLASYPKSYRNFNYQQIKEKNPKQIILFRVEFIFFIILSGGMQYIILSGLGIQNQKSSFEYLLILFIIWASFRYSPLLCSLHLLWIAISTIIGIYTRNSSFYFDDIEIASLLAQIFMIVLSLTNLVLNSLINEHRRNLSVKILSGYLPICSICKKIKNDEGEWLPLETFMNKNSEAKFSHGFCNICEKEIIEENDL